MKGGNAEKRSSLRSGRPPTRPGHRRDPEGHPGARPAGGMRRKAPPRPARRRLEPVKALPRDARWFWLRWVARAAHGSPRRRAWVRAPDRRAGSSAHRCRGSNPFPPWLAPGSLAQFPPGRAGRGAGRRGSPASGAAWGQSTRFKRKAFRTTVTELRPMAAPASIGPPKRSSWPKAAKGTRTRL